jgi:hypothetical protein
MSEYQYYEFQAIDRPLTDKEQQELRGLSSRAEISATGFVNVYHYGDFRGNVPEVLDRYFDAFLYVANWGTHRLMFRLPRELVDVAAFEGYCDEEVVTLQKTKKHVLLDFCSRLEDGGEWEEGAGRLAPLISLRADLLAGDLRPLYLGWLAGISGRDPEDEELEGAVEPPVPPGLGKLSGPLRELADFLRVDTDLLGVAAEASAAGGPAGPSHEELAAWIAARPERQKNDWLLALAEESGPSPRYELLRLFRQDWAAKRPKGEVGGAGRRTVVELLTAQETREAERKRREAEARAREKERRAREEAAARQRHLETLVGREGQLWAEAEQAIGTTQPKQYDHAVSLLVDLRDLAQRQGKPDDFSRRARELRERHRNKPSLLQRLNKVGL